MPPIASGTYPAARPGRLGGAAALQAAASASPAPRVRFINFDLSATGFGFRTTVSTPRLQGPLIIRSMRYSTDGSVIPPAHALELGTAQLPIVEDSVAVATPKSFTSLMERIVDAAPTSTGAGPGIIHGTSGAGGPNWNAFDVGLIVPEPEVFLVVSVSANTAATMNFWGYVVVVEGVNPQALANFL